MTAPAASSRAWWLVVAAVVAACRAGADGPSAVAADPPREAAVAEPAEDPAAAQRRQQVKQQAAHWEQQLHKVLRGDLELVRTLCGDLPRESRRAIVAAGETAVKEAALRMAELQMGDQHRREGDHGPESTPPRSPVDAVSDAVSRSVATHVGGPRAEAVAGELAARAGRRRQSVIHELVAALDAEVFLTSGQREVIERDLERQWNDGMAVAVEGMHRTDGRRTFPGVPADCIVPHLSPQQRQRLPMPDLDRRPEALAARRRQAWMHELNTLNTVQTPARDGWWSP